VEGAPRALRVDAPRVGATSTLASRVQLTSWEGVQRWQRRAEHTHGGTDLMTGAGTVDRVGSGTFGPLDMTWAARTGEEPGQSSPEELIAAAHASCF
jgi:organic hydroperoxide reductase OsmC/OhrA